MEKKSTRTNQQYSKIDLINDLKRVANDSPDKKLTASLYISKGNYPISVILKTFGSWSHALSQTGLKQYHIYTENDYLEDIRLVANQFSDVPLTSLLYDKHGKYRSYNIMYKFGNWHNALQKAGIEHDNKIKIHKFRDSEEDLLNDLIKADKHKKDNESLQTYYRKNGKHAITTYYLRFGSWNNALEKAGLQHKNNTENDYLEDIKQVANQFSDSKLTFTLYTKHGKFSRHLIMHKFGCWNNALQIAGINYITKPYSREASLSDEDLLNDLIQADKYKKDNETLYNYYRKNGKYSIVTYYRRFGRWKNTLQKAGIKNDNKIKNYKPRSSEEDLLNDLIKSDKLKKDNESLLTYYRKNGKYAISTYHVRFGNWNNAVEKAGIIYKKNTENDYIEDIKQVANLYPDLQLTYSLYSKHGKFSRRQFIYKFGNWRKALQKAGIINDNNINMYKFKYSEENLLHDLKQAAKYRKDNESLWTYYFKNGKYSISTYILRFGNWNNALEKAELIFKKHTKNDYLDDIKLVAKQFPDSQLTSSLYTKHGKFSKNQINYKFSTWCKALQKAGIINDDNINMHKFRISDEDLLNDLKQSDNHKKNNKSFLTYYRKNGKYDISTYNRRFGSWKNALQKAGLLHKNDNESPL